jgi:hypothetical protein
MSEDIEADIRAGAARALRRRANRQRAIAKSWTVTGETGVRFMSGEAAITLRIAAALDQAADEIEADAPR